jgi:hypothetical protein
MKYTIANYLFGMSNTMIMVTVALVLFTFMLMVAPLEYPYHVANAKKLTGGTHIITNHTTNCNGSVCQVLVCINNKCHRSNPNQASNSTIP